MRLALTSLGFVLAAVVATAPLSAAAPKKPVAKARAAAKTPARPAVPVGQVKLPVLSYTIEKSGPATGAHPDRGDIITVNYKLTLLDGKVVDTTEGKAPATFPLNRLIPAWQVLIQLMRPGDIWTLYVPPEYAYGSVAQGDDLPANSFLTFRVELVSVGEPQAPTFKQEQ
jgi:peptidylprolyl isomerase/FKBP-type peptidyl-prolyl cis-trans isomerase FklB